MNETLISNQSWLELESDPGLFTLLVNDFGVEDIEVEEVYDLSRPIDTYVYGFIFLFKWADRRTRRRQIETLNYETNVSKINSMFFAQQIVPNSCATHALLSVLLNCENVKLGNVLSEFKKSCNGMTPEQKGNAIGSQKFLFKAHNSYAKPELNNSKQQMSRQSSDSKLSTSTSSSNLLTSNTNTNDVFHYVSFVVVNNHLYELDGLKPYPIDHGQVNNSLNWSEIFFKIINERIHGFSNSDIRYNLMAVVPDKMSLFKENIIQLEKNQSKLQNFINENLNNESFYQIIPDNDLLSDFEVKKVLNKENSSIDLNDIKDVLTKIVEKLGIFQNKLKEEEEKRKKYKIDALRRKHKYDDFIVTFIYCLIENGQLNKIIESQYDVKANKQHTYQNANKKLRKK